jgi:hypothetical protein
MGKVEHRSGSQKLSRQEKASLTLHQIQEKSGHKRWQVVWIYWSGAITAVLPKENIRYEDDFRKCLWMVGVKM